MFDTPDPVCPDLGTTLDQFRQSAQYRNWLNTDPNIPASAWTPEQQALTAAVLPAMSSMLDMLEKIATKTSNPIVGDLLNLGIQYQRVAIQAMPTYQSNDNVIRLAGQAGTAVVSMACKYAVG